MVENLEIYYCFVKIQSPPGCRLLGLVIARRKERLFLRLLERDTSTKKDNFTVSWQYLYAQSLPA